MQLKNVTLEMSLKPFKDTSEATARNVCRELFRQWWPLCRHADMVSVLLWAADGSEILEYRRDLEARFEWAKWLGSANASRPPHPNDPEGRGIHCRRYLYMEQPPEFSYGWLKRLVATIKELGREVTGKPIRVGETFDPGPEFAESAFKYVRHPELSMGKATSTAGFACCYATLRADPTPYAGFPAGISEGTPFGTFLGRQCQFFLTDMGFDYVWFSNGFGFGLETWGLRGAVFDGEHFSAERCAEVSRKNLAFWDRFRAECPSIPIETRGTNLSTGMDLSSDAVPLREIYEGGYGMEPPPNSPWAALNHDFGLELIGWMSHIAEIPGSTFPFRFYTHDPWWINSPWLDRYEREPHDIYLPLSVSRIDAAGTARTPTSILFLTADDSYGNMPEQVPNEVIPHVLTGKRDEPDQAGPLLWVYPFDEYHEWTFGTPSRIEEVFFGDWFMRGAINHGLPLNTVISTRSLIAATAGSAAKFAESVLVSPVPAAGSAWQAAILGHVGAGGRLLLYGPIAHADAELLALLNLKRIEPLSGEFELDVEVDGDTLAEQPYATRLNHPGLLSAGGMDGAMADTADPHTTILATATQARQPRVAAMTRALPEWHGGRIIWVRGTVACDPTRTGGHLLVPFNPATYFPGELLMRYALQAFGFRIVVEKDTPAQKSPMTCVARHAGGFFFSGFTPDTTSAIRLRFPQGAPLLLGLETWLSDGDTRYTMPKAWHRECRVFVDQAQNGRLACHEVCSGMVGVKRRFVVSGLANATVRFYHEPGTESKVRMLRNGVRPYLTGDFVAFAVRNDALGCYLQADGISGELVISW